ncbi:hypothetical protein KS461_10735 [Pseudomonas chlororaphis]|uniref:hypothetical protein n=1 Tax=Pseudomonas chlororaphis TaxID=587753 RepID=UPI00215A4D15|nr:hypothetical protein [Pseudomonas chlororaphis]UVE47720.1 hypothetical protein KS461_10735 [Pseudomonas chlororaphis]
MEDSAQGIAAELMSQIERKLPSRPLVGGGFHHFVIRASVVVEATPAVSFEAFEILLQLLADSCREWEIEICGGLDDLEVTFSR